MIPALLLAACSQPPPAPACCALPEPSPEVQAAIAASLSEEQRTIISPIFSEPMTRQCSRISPEPVEGTWRVSYEDIEPVEAPLMLLLTERLRDAETEAAPIDYYRQYAGFIIGGRRIIYVNGVHESAVERAEEAPQATDWRAAPIQICDGGTITFGVEYDPATQTFDKFAFNGGF